MAEPTLNLRTDPGSRHQQRQALLRSSSSTNGNGGNHPSWSFARDVARGLSSSPRSLDCRYLYDRRGSELFEQICEQPEYYPTRTEEAILREHAPRIAAFTGPVTLVELGAGTSLKTQHVLRAYCEVEDEPFYVAVDVSSSALEKGRKAVEHELPAVQFHPFCATYDEGVRLLPHVSPAMLAFLGSTIGNFGDGAFESFWRSVADHLVAGDHFLLGVDLHKETRTLEAAYNDAAGVTAEFTRNLFARINRELGASIDLEAVEHRAHYSSDQRQVEISATFSTPQEIYLAPLDQSYHIEAGESIRTEVSRKFSVDALVPELEGLGFLTRHVFTDEQKWFAVLLLERDV